MVMENYLLLIGIFKSVHCTFKTYCYTSQLKSIAWLEENMSRAVGQNSPTPWGEQSSLIP